jgi:exopolysaccharide biosynthesis operon protein EpsL
MRGLRSFPIPLRARRLWVLFFATCWPAASPAAYDSTDVIQIQASATWVHDSNLFRLPQNSAPPPTADTTRILGAGLKFDEVVSRQHLIADFNLNNSAFEKNTNLDYTGGDGRLAWLWQAGNDWSGEARYQRARTLADFAYIQQNVQDLIDTHAYALTGGYQFHPRWRIAAEFAAEELVHSATGRETLDVNSRSAGSTLTYRTPGDNSIGLQARRTDRSYPNPTLEGNVLVDNGHRETRLNAIAAWRFSGVLKLDAQIGHVEVRFDEFSNRDFSGATGRAAATWDPTGKLRLSLNGLRDVQLYTDVSTSYTVVTSVGLSPIYTVTPKIVVQGDFNLEKRDYLGDPGIVPPTGPAREDHVRLARVSVRYSPIRSVELSVSYETGNRESNVPANSFEYQLWLATVKASF